MKNKTFRNLLAISAIAFLTLGASAQNSLPAPGTGGGFNPNPPNGIGWNPGPGGPGGPMGPGPGGMWGSPWSPGWNNSPTLVIQPSITIGNTVNQGVKKVIACGYDAQGVWRVLPLLVSYQYNGVQYNVTVINAWDPWTNMWNRNIDVDAFNTAYILRGITYNYYVVLSYGTFYFNLA